MSREAWIVVATIGGLLIIASLVGCVLLLIRLFRIRRQLGDLGVGGKVAFYGALIFTFFPVDLLPDPIYLDDMGVLAAATIYLGHLLERRRAGSPPAPVPRSRPAPGRLERRR